MRTRLLISMIALAGLSASVAASSTPPVTVTENAGVTKVEKFNDLVKVYVLEITAPFDALVSVVAFSETENASAPLVSDQSEKLAITFLALENRKEAPVVTNQEDSYHKLVLKGSVRRCVSKKIYLYNCSILQFTKIAVATA